MNNQKNNKINNLINNQCIENHIASMLENVLYGENKSEVDNDCAKENQFYEMNNQKNNKNKINEYSEFYPKSNKNQYLKLNTYSDNYQQPEILINAPDANNEFIDIGSNKNLMMNQNNMNNMNNKNLTINPNNLSNKYSQRMMPNFNSLSPINKNLMKKTNFREEDNPNKMQNNRLHINYVNPIQNLYFSKKNNSISPREMENNQAQNSNSFNNNNNSPNNPSPRQGGFNNLFQNENNISTSINR